MRNLLRLIDSGPMLKSTSKRLTVAAGMVVLLIVLGCGGTEQPSQSPSPEPAPTAGRCQRHPIFL